jgi:membrane protein DedA with SNARE-associated domain
MLIFMFENLASYLVNLILQFGYLGILIAMIIESTFILLPSELILIPAGYLWYLGHLNSIIIVLMSVLGSLIGSYFTYWLGEKLGRPFVEKHKKWFFLNDERISKMDLFFKKYGSSSIFFARLLIGIRHYSSFPAGFTKMNKWKFILYTALGSFIWSLFLVLLGYFLGAQMQLIKAYIWYFTFATIALIIFIFIFIKIRNIRKRKLESKIK